MLGIREIAKLAGVSPATVSRVLNGTAVVDPKTQERVQEVIRDTGYRPNEVARSLSKHSSRIIGCIVPDIANPFFTEIARAIEDEAYRQGYRLILCNSDEDPQKEIEYIDMLTRMNADGIIITTTQSDAELTISNRALPVIVLDRKSSHFHSTASICSDHYQGGRLATQHLVNCGCKKIVMMQGPGKNTSAELRLQGYLDVCRESGRNPVTIECGFTFAEGLKQAKVLLETYPDVDGIIAANDLVALSVYKILTAAGITVPGQVQVIGFDNIYLSSLMTPALTTIGQPITQIGTLAASRVIDWVEGKGGAQAEKDTVLPVELIVRETTRF